MYSLRYQSNDFLPNPPSPTILIKVCRRCPSNALYPLFLKIMPQKLLSE